MENAFCSQCGNKLMQDSKFCASCGNVLNAGAAPSTPALEQQPQYEQTAPNNYNVFPSSNADAGESVILSIKRLKLIPTIIIAIMAVIVIIAVIASTINSERNKPFNAFMLAAQKVENAGGFDFRIKMETYGTNIDMKGSLIIDYKKEDIIIDANATTKSRWGGNETARVVLYDGLLMTIEDGRVTNKQDISDEIKASFRNYNKHFKNTRSVTDIDIEKMLFDIFDSMDMGYIYDNMLDELDINFRRFNQGLGTFIKDLNNESYLKERFNFEKTSHSRTTEYSVRIKPDVLIKEMQRHFGFAIPALEDLFYDDFEDEPPMNLKYTIERGFLTEFSYRINDGGSVSSMSIKFENIGKSELDKNQLKRFYDEANSFTMDGLSMQPTIENGDVLKVEDLNTNPKHGDVILLYAPNLYNDSFGYGKEIIKRVVGVEGDTIRIEAWSTGDGLVYRNGVPLEITPTQNGYIENGYQITSPTYSQGHTDTEVTVPKGFVFVLGDNRSNSTDSRCNSVGLVSVNYIKGKIVLH
jgi:signal peptidase I